MKLFNFLIKMKISSKYVLLGFKLYFRFLLLLDFYTSVVTTALAAVYYAFRPSVLLSYLCDILREFLKFGTNSLFSQFSK